MSNEQLKGKVALVTGASAGMGREAALQFARDGAEAVVVLARRKERLDALVTEIEALGAKALAVQADVSSLEDNQRAVDETVKAFGRLDAVFLNAGTFRGQEPIQDLTADTIDTLLNINVKGVLYGLKAAIPALLAGADEGGADKSVVVNSSTMGKRVRNGGSNGASVYSATKAFVNSLVESAAIENAGKIRVNAVAPGLVHTEIMGEDTPREVFDKFASQLQLIKRAGYTKEIAEFVSYLAGSRSKFVTGQVMVIDGGWALA